MPCCFKDKVESNFPYLSSARMDDLVKSFKAVLYDRVTSPLLSSFLFAWAAWNHRLFVVLISSDLKIKDKFEYVDTVLYPTLYEKTFPGFVWPLLSALVLIFVYPWPARKVYEYARKEQQRLKVIQQKIEDETPLTQEEARELRASVRKAAAEFDKQLSDRDGQIQKLKADLNAADSGPVSAAPVTIRENTGDSAMETRDEVPHLSPDQLEILNTIAASPEPYDAYTFYVGRVSGSDRVRRRYNLDELERYGLVGSRLEQGEHVFEATAEGRAYAVKHPFPTQQIPITVVELNQNENSG